MTASGNAVSERPQSFPPSDAHDRRAAEQRRLVLKRATIIKNISISEITCTLLDQSDSGAQLRVPVDLPVPLKFLLYVPVDGVAYHSTVRWRRSERIGVQFSGIAGKPRRHYG